MRSKGSFLMRRSAGVLMPITALSSEAPCGNFGETARRFVDALSGAGVEFWQILPLSVPGKGNSPYSSPSAFALSPLYLDANMLCNEGYIESVPEFYEDQPGKKVCYKDARDYAENLVTKAAEKFDIQNPDYLNFCRDNKFWLNDYALFCAARDLHETNRITEWSDPIRRRDPDAIEALKKVCQGYIERIQIEQYLVRRQWDGLRQYANQKKVKIIGDIPIYVAPGSADVWAHPSLFTVGADLTPLSVAGVPPDVFSESGQLWGNPVYHWPSNRSTDFAWWLFRLKYSLDLYDYIRIDHFRAFSTYYSIPYGSSNAKAGTWEYAPGKELFKRAKKHLGKLRVIAEDLGGTTPDVYELLQFTGFPGMKILQFAFDSKPDNQFVLEKQTAGCVCYTGTHDNDTIEHWYTTLSPKECELFERKVPKFSGASVSERLIRYGASGKADLFIVPLQDVLGLGGEARFNTPSTETGNWEWRMNPEALIGLEEKLYALLASSGRLRK